jgi:hypothetical protein
MPGKPRVSAYRWPVSRQRGQPFLNLLPNHFEGKRGDRALSVVNYSRNPTRFNLEIAMRSDFAEYPRPTVRLSS